MTCAQPVYLKPEVERRIHNRLKRLEGRVRGVSGAGLASTFEPLRPYFVVATVLALAFGHWSLRREEANARNAVVGRP